MFNQQEILNKYCLTIDKIIKSMPDREIYLLIDKNNNKYALKIYKYNNEALKQEIDFLTRIKNIDFTSIRFPEIVDSGYNYLLFNYIDRELIHRSTALKRRWSEDDVNLWVNGLIEFQNIEIKINLFSLKKRILGFIFPVFRMIILMPKCRDIISLNKIIIISKLLVLYIICRLSFKNVPTHYDLQSYNYTFIKKEKKMSMIDFEFLYYKGDPLYDILHYITIPLQKMEDWTFQIDLLNEFLRNKYKNTRKIRSLLYRIRLILLICNLSRLLNFQNEKEKKEVYIENVSLLLNKSSFKYWISKNLKCIHK